MNSKPSSPSMPRTETPTVGSTSLEKVNFDNRIKRKNVLALNEKVAAIREYEKMPVYKHVGRMFNCSPDQIKRIVQQRDTILAAWEQRTRRCQDAKTLEMKVVRVSMLGKAVYDWVRRMMYYKDFMITDGLIQKMALQFKSAMGLQNFFPHQEWCDKFRITYNISSNDTKQLKIGYTQGYSVQIKDIIKDVLTECTPEKRNKQADEHEEKEIDEPMHMENDICDMSDDDDLDDDDDDDNDDDGDDDEFIDYDSDCSDSHNVNKNGDSEQNNDDIENKDEDVDIDGDTSDQEDIKPALGINANPPQLQPHVLPPLQPLHQLLALPFKTNAPPGTIQKVLVATPITMPNGQPVVRKEGVAKPMTMTIIPLATLSQSVQQQQQKLMQLKMNPVEKVATVPPPKLDIKQEIKEEPKDPDDNSDEAIKKQQEADDANHIIIKQEILSDDENEASNLVQSIEASTNIVTAPARVITPVPINLKFNDELQSSGALFNEYLANLRPKSVEPQTERIQAKSMERLNIECAFKMQQSLCSAVPSPPPPKKMVFMADHPQQKQQQQQQQQQLQKQQQIQHQLQLQHNNHQLQSTAQNQQQLQEPPTLKRASNQTIRNIRNVKERVRRSGKINTNRRNDNALPAISSYSEARKYLKLLEDFALCKENFRLIGLITRADEVLRELDDERDLDENMD